jgi:hypothetical protein
LHETFFIARRGEADLRAEPQDAERMALDEEKPPPSGVERSDMIEDPLSMQFSTDILFKTRMKSGENACIRSQPVYIFA